MGYRITAFGTVSLPSRHETQDATTGDMRSTLIRLPGGAFDAGGTALVREPGGYPLRVSGVVTAATAAELKTAIYALRALRGSYDELYRTPDGGSANSEYVWARCMGVHSERSWQQRLHEDVTLDFEVESPHWYGAATTFTGNLTSGTESVVVVNDGNVHTEDVTFSIVAGTAPITQLDIWRTLVPKFRIRYGGTLVGLGTLVFDCGARAVTNNGTDDYANFAFVTANHEIDSWARIIPANPTVNILRTGGGTDASYEIAFRASWA